MGQRGHHEWSRFPGARDEPEEQATCVKFWLEIGCFHLKRKVGQQQRDRSDGSNKQLVELWRWMWVRWCWEPAGPAGKCGLVCALRAGECPPCLMGKVTLRRRVWLLAQECARWREEGSPSSLKFSEMLIAVRYLLVLPPVLP